MKRNREVRALLDSGGGLDAIPQERYRPHVNPQKRMPPQTSHGSHASLLSIVSRCQAMLNALGRPKERGLSRANSQSLSQVWFASVSRLMVSCLLAWHKERHCRIASTVHSN